MEPRLRSGQDETTKRTFEAMGAFSAEGLRTLVCACGELPGPRFEEWLTAYRAATSDLREVRKRQSIAVCKSNSGLSRLASIRLGAL